MPDLTRLACAPGRYRLEVLNRVRLLYPPATDGIDQPQLIPLTDGNPTYQALTLLALHPDGMRKDKLCALLWPDSANPTRAYNTMTYRLRQAIADQLGADLADPIKSTAKHVQLDPNLITVDYWDLLHTLGLNKTDQLDKKALGYQLATTNYQGEVAPEIDGEWIVPYRQEIREKAVNGALCIAEALVERKDTDRAIEILEHAAQLDEYNEEALQHIITIQRATGNHTAAEHTYKRLVEKLGEIGIEPTSEAS